MFGKPKGSITEYRNLLKKELDEKQAIERDCEARQPELKRTYEASAQALSGHVKEVYAGGHGGMHPAQIERNRLQQTRQERYDVLSACESELARVRPCIAELARLLDADAAVEHLTEKHATGLANAAVIERKIKSEDDMIAAIDADKAARAERRRPAKGDESDDGDIDSQRTAAAKLRDKYTTDLQALVEDLSSTRKALIRVRFDAAELRLKAALFGIKAEINEYEAAREFAQYYGREATLSIDDIAVRAHALRDEIPGWVPAAKRNSVAPVSADTPVVTEAAA